MRKRSFLKLMLATTVLAGAGFPALAAGEWDGPTTGPAGAPGKSIVVVAADMKNGGILGVSNGVEEAASQIGWSMRLLDGAGSIQGRTAAIGQALALQPDGIVINGFDAVEQQAALEEVVAAGIPIVAWHSGPKIGCDAPGGIFANVSTDAMTVSEVAANWAIEDGGKDIGAIIFTDSTYQIAIDKADRIKETIEAAGGKVLEYVDTPIADTSSRMGPLTTSLLQKYGDDWTHALAINDLYFDFMGPALASAGISSDAGPQAGSAGDGSEAAFFRIKTGAYQSITVAEPLNLQGWQLVDELNRAIQGEPCSGYVTSPALVTKEGVERMGDSSAFDPDIPYREAYSAIWNQ